MNRFPLGIGLAGVCLAACASAPAPHDREASTAAAIRGAQEVGAAQVPQAALHLKLAQEQFDKAKGLMNDGDNNRAAFVLLRAQADAELALAVARENKTRADAQDILDRVRAARSSISPGLTGPSGNPSTSQN